MFIPRPDTVLKRDSVALSMVTAARCSILPFNNQIRPQSPLLHPRGRAPRTTARSYLSAEPAQISGFVRRPPATRIRCPPEASSTKEPIAMKVRSHRVVLAVKSKDMATQPTVYFRSVLHILRSPCKGHTVAFPSLFHRDHAR